MTNPIQRYVAYSDDVLHPIQHVDPGDINTVVVLAAEAAAHEAQAVDAALVAAKRAVRDECYHDDGEWCVYVAAIEALRTRQTTDGN